MDPRDVYVDEFDRYLDSSRPQDTSRRNKGHVVRFAPGAYGKKAMSRNEEAMRDREEAEEDQHAYNDAKRGIRKSVHKGAGPYEMLDGACDTPPSNVRLDL